MIPVELKSYDISLHLTRLNRKFNESICSSSNDNKYGKAKKFLRKNEISISLGLAERAFSNKSHFNCFHKNFKSLLKATLIHELIHLYDFKHKISEKEEFKSLIGLRKNKLNNKSIKGSVDVYEYSNAKESFAVNYEYFILDPLYQCKKPAYYHFYQSIFKKTITEVTCDKYKHVLINSHVSDENLRRYKRLDISKLYQVHFLFADKGKSMMSRWGHAMFRLVVCGPERPRVSEKCLNDISHHLVVSYRAKVSDSGVDYLAGLTGKYASQLFIYDLSEIIQEYTKFEFRDLISVPLKMNELEKKKFLNITLQKFWDYKGKYLFLSNNCASESNKHMKASFESDQNTIKSNIPLKTVKKILKIQSKKEFKREKEQLLSRNLVFKSQEEKLLKSLDIISKYFDLPSDLNEYGKIEVKSRLKNYKEKIRKIKNLSLKERLLIFVHLRRIESYFSFKFERKIQIKVEKILLTHKNLREDFRTYENIGKAFQVDRWDIIKESNSYGIPNSDLLKKELLKSNKAKKDDLGKSDQILNFLEEHNQFSEILEEQESTNEIQSVINDILKD